MNIPEKVRVKASKIRAIFFDIDGVLTDGSITYSSSGDELKSFNVKDGQIIKPLKSKGIIVGAITGRSSEAVNRRCEELQLDFFSQGVKDKWSLISEKLVEYSLEADEVCYLGDDLIDMKALNNVGLSVCPADAPEYVHELCDFVSCKNGGKGVLREASDMILESQGLLNEILEDYR